MGEKLEKKVLIYVTTFLLDIFWLKVLAIKKRQNWQLDDENFKWLGPN